MPISIKHFDTINASYTSTPFNSRFEIQNPIKNIKKIYLKSFELSLDFCNVRAGLNTFTVRYNSILYTVTLNDKVYTSIGSLLTDLNSAYTGIISGVNVGFTTSNNQIILTLTGSAPLTFSIIPTNFSNYILGFKMNTGSASGNTYTITGSNPYLLNADNYLIFNIGNLPLSNNNISNQLCNFKIPLNASNGMVYFENEYNSLIQFCENSETSKILTNLEIKLYDRFGNQLTQSNNDFSFTLGFETD